MCHETEHYQMAPDTMVSGAIAYGAEIRTIRRTTVFLTPIRPDAVSVNTMFLENKMNLQNILTILFRNLREWHRRQIAIYHLSELEEHQLRDIGIERHNIVGAVNGRHSVQTEETANRQNTCRPSEDRLIFGPATLNAN